MNPQLEARLAQFLMKLCLQPINPVIGQCSIYDFWGKFLRISFEKNSFGIEYNYQNWTFQMNDADLVDRLGDVGEILLNEKRSLFIQDVGRKIPHIVHWSLYERFFLGLLNFRTQ